MSFNPRSKERNFARGLVDLFDGVLNTLDGLEKGKPLPTAIREGFEKSVARTGRAPAATKVPYCLAHNRPLSFCYICKRDPAAVQAAEEAAGLRPLEVTRTGERK